jgi:uncharacterized protein (DUF2461 family)
MIDVDALKALAAEWNHQAELCFANNNDQWALALQGCAADLDKVIAQAKPATVTDAHLLPGNPQRTTVDNLRAFIEEEYKAGYAVVDAAVRAGLGWPDDEIVRSAPRGDHAERVVDRTKFLRLIEEYFPESASPFDWSDSTRFFAMMRDLGFTFTGDASDAPGIDEESR